MERHLLLYGTRKQFQIWGMLFCNLCVFLCFDGFYRCILYFQTFRIWIFSEKFKVSTKTVSTPLYFLILSAWLKHNFVVVLCFLAIILHINLLFSMFLHRSWRNLRKTPFSFYWTNWLRTRSSTEIGENRIFNICVLEQCKVKNNSSDNSQSVPSLRNIIFTQHRFFAAWFSPQFPCTIILVQARYIFLPGMLLPLLLKQPSPDLVIEQLNI